MTLQAILTAGAAATLLSSTTAIGADVASNKVLVLEALKNVVGARNPDRVADYFTPEYIQHNPMVPSGQDGLKGFIAMLKDAPNFKNEYVRVIGEGDLVALHGRYQGLGGMNMVAFDVFRLENGRIDEHWDNLIPEALPNPSGRTQLDGETAMADLEKTAANKVRVVDFVTRALIKHEEVDYTQYINPTKYIQHNPMVADGLEGFAAFLAEMGKKGITMSYDKIHLTVAEGNFVLTASEGSFGGRPQAFYDLFRLEDGLIVEHWDVIADMPGEPLPAGYPGKF